MSEKIWTSMLNISEKLLLDRAQPNQTLVEEALSFNAADLNIIPEPKLRQYLVVLGQYLITLQYEENMSEAVCTAWQRALDSHIYRVLNKSKLEDSSTKKLTVAEKRAYVLETDDQALTLNNAYEEADSKRCLLSNMHKPVEQYINTLKKEIDARINEKKNV